MYIFVGKTGHTQETRARESGGSVLLFLPPPSSHTEPKNRFIGSWPRLVTPPYRNRNSTLEMAPLVDGDANCVHRLVPQPALNFDGRIP